MRTFDSGKGLSSARFAAAMILFVSVPAIVFVPISTVIGRSVFSRNVMHGIPSTVVSSWIPPESVRTRRAQLISRKKSRYPTGSMTRRFLMLWTRGPRPSSSIILRVRGCAGKMIGRSRAISSSASRIRTKAAGSSTFEGRCNVSTA